MIDDDAAHEERNERERRDRDDQIRGVRCDAPSRSRVSQYRAEVCNERNEREQPCAEDDRGADHVRLIRLAREKRLERSKGGRIPTNKQKRGDDREWQGKEYAADRG